MRKLRKKIIEENDQQNFLFDKKKKIDVFHFLSFFSRLKKIFIDIEQQQSNNKNKKKTKNDQNK